MLYEVDGQWYKLDQLRESHKIIYIPVINEFKKKIGEELLTEIKYHSQENDENYFECKYLLSLLKNSKIELSEIEKYIEKDELKELRQNYDSVLNILSINKIKKIDDSNQEFLFKLDDALMYVSLSDSKSIFDKIRDEITSMLN